MTEFVSFKAMTDAMAGDLKRVFREQLPFASVVALTRTAVIARDAVRADEKRVFRSPTPYAVNAPRAVVATKQTMASAVILRDTGSVPAGNYLGPEIDAGRRGVKRFEMALRYKGVLPSGMFVVPSKREPLDRYGNMSEGRIEEVLAGLNAYQPGTALARRIIRRNTRRVLARHPKKPVKFYVAKSKITAAPLGVWEVVSRGQVRPVMIFVRQPEYRERLDFYGVVRRAAEQAFPNELDRALSEVTEK